MPNKGRLTITRHGIIGEDGIELTLVDKNSILKVIEVHISLEDFMRALT